MMHKCRDSVDDSTHLLRCQMLTHGLPSDQFYWATIKHQRNPENSQVQLQQKAQTDLV